MMDLYDIWSLIVRAILRKIDRKPEQEEASIYENNDKTKIKRREKVTEDYPNEIKIGENKLFNKKNIKEDMLKGIVMKEILDKPRAKKSYKSIYKRK